LALGLFATRLERRGLTARHLFGVGFGLNLAALALITTRALPFTYLIWALYGIGSTVNVLAFAVLNAGFPRVLTGRVNTALNLTMFVGSFSAQWGIGLLVDAARAAFATDTAGGLRLAFALVLGADVIAYAWFLLGWRRHASATPVQA
jgi:hypothetical protein